MASTSASDCSASTCPVENGFLLAQPSLAGNTVLLAAFAVLVPITLCIGVVFRTPLYAASFILGLLFEVMGYAGRIVLRTDLASKSYFVLFLLGTVMGPTFITGAMYSVLPHIMGLYGEDLSIVSRPVYLGVFFLAFDVFTLAFQAVGAAFASQGSSREEMHQGSNILIVGLVLQITSLVAFIAIYYHFVLRVVRNRHLLDPLHADVYLSGRFKSSMICMQLASGLILIRTVARTYQVASGPASGDSQSEVFTLVLDGALVLLACILLTLLPPAAAFHGAWAPTSPRRRRSKYDRQRPHHLALQPRSPGGPTYYFPAPANARGQISPPLSGGQASSQGGGGPSPRPSPTFSIHGHQRYHNRRQASAPPPVQGQSPPPYEQRGNYKTVPYQPAVPVSAAVVGAGPPTGSTGGGGGGGGTVTTPPSSRRFSTAATESSAGGASESGSAGHPRTGRWRRAKAEEDLVEHDAIW